MTSQSNNISGIERDQSLKILDENMPKIILPYKECYLSMGRGGLLIYAQNIAAGILPNKHDYRAKADMLEVFDEPRSQGKLGKMLNHYNTRTEGIMALITSQLNETYFVTCKFG